jgi:hypothetical protein
MVVLAAGTALGGPRRLAAQAGEQAPNAIRVEPSPQLFATLCALYAAGYPVMPSPTPDALQDLVRKMGRLQGPAVENLRQFYREHRQSSAEATLASYVSFALVAGAPPDFQYQVPQEGLPPDVRALAGFREVLADFYREQKIEQLWEQVEPYYEREAAGMRGPVSQVVTVASAYTRRMQRFTGEGGGSFTVYADPLIGTATNFRIYSEKYEIAVNPGSADAVAEIQHAFLHFLLDSLPFEDRAVVESKQALMTVAVNAPRLPQQYKDDFVSFTDECLVRAVDLRLRRMLPIELAAQLDKNDRYGYVLVRPLYEGLIGYGESPDTLRAHFLKLMRSIDVKTELARDEKIQFAAAAATPTPAEAEANQIGRWLEEGNRQIAGRDPKGAVETFERILKQDPGNTRALYGLAVASVLSGQAVRARQLFRQIVKTPVSGASADPSAVAWSHVYLGRMSDLEGQRQDALTQYRAALAVDGAPQAAREAAERGVAKPYTPAKETDPGASPHR